MAHSTSANKFSVNNLTVFNTCLTAILKMEAVFSSETLKAPTKPIYQLNSARCEH